MPGNYDHISLTQSNVKQLIDTLTLSRDHFGLTAQSICQFLNDSRSIRHHQLIYATANNYFNLEKQLNEQLQLLGINTTNPIYSENAASVLQQLKHIVLAEITCNTIVFSQQPNKDITAL
ncbi:hypothetical protein [Aliikangiella maris]|uniref:Uncharacterized protein n=2 Tax=Aliikangiella maris TaxID=3162458 RepID=A0ABV2BYL2_9GAMM